MRRAHPLRSLAAGAMASFALLLVADLLAPATLRSPRISTASTIPHTLPD